MGQLMGLNAPSTTVYSPLNWGVISKKIFEDLRKLGDGQEFVYEAHNVRRIVVERIVVKRRRGLFVVMLPRNRVVFRSVFVVVGILVGYCEARENFD